jgi:hypothetical protein
VAWEILPHSVEVTLIITLVMTSLVNYVDQYSSGVNRRTLKYLKIEKISALALRTLCEHCGKGHFFGYGKSGWQQIRQSPLRCFNIQKVPRLRL